MNLNECDYTVEIQLIFKHYSGMFMANFLQVFKFVPRF